MNEEYTPLQVVEVRATEERLNRAKHGVIVKMNRPINEHDKEDGYYMTPAVDSLWPEETYPWHIEYGLVSDDEVLLCWTNDNEERFICPKYNHEGQITAEWQVAESGKIWTWDNAAPGIGQVIWRVDRKDDEGVWGLCISDTRWIPE